MKKYIPFIISILVVFGLSALSYYIIQHSLENFNLISTAIDDKIPLISWYIYFYMIWYPLEIVALLLIYRKDRKTFFKTIITMTISFIMAHIIFIVYPTTVNRPVIDSYHDLTSWIVYMTYKGDMPVNCFPSVHCLFALIVSFGAIKAKNISQISKVIITFINIMIVFSTIFVKQHALSDVGASVVISIMNFYFLSNLRIFTKLKNKLVKLS